MDFSFSDAFKMDEKRIRRFVSGDFDLSSPWVDGMNSAFSISRIGNDGYKNITIHEKNKEAYLSEKDPNYIYSIVVYYLSGTLYCKEGNYKTFYIYKKNDKYMYSEKRNSTHKKTVFHPCPINIEEVVSSFDMDELDILKGKAPGKPLKMKFTQSKTYAIDDTFTYSSKDGYSYSVKVEDILSCRVVEVDGVKKYETELIVIHNTKKDKK